MSDRPRLTYIDHLRILLIVLVIVGHSAITFVPLGHWYVKLRTVGLLTRTILMAVPAIIQSFVLGLFFFISGYFIPGSYERKGTRRFLSERLVRLGIPSLVYFFALGPLAAYLSLVDIYHRPYTYLPHIGVMWFAVVLLGMSVAFAVWQMIFKTAPHAGPQDSFPTWPQIVLAVLGVAIPVFLLRCFFPKAEEILGGLGDFLEFSTLFVFGTIAYRRNWLSTLRSVKIRTLALIVGGLLLFIPFIAFNTAPAYDFSSYLGGFHWQALSFAVWESGLNIAGSMLLLRLFQERFDTQRGYTATLATAAYGVYVIHPPLLVVGAYLVRSLPVHALVKFGLLVCFGTTTAFLLASLPILLSALRTTSSRTSTVGDA